MGVVLNPGCPEFGGTIIKVNSVDKNGAVDFCIDYPDSGMIEIESVNFQNLYPIEINSFWRGIINKKIDTPPKIKYVHEFQNWYSINHRKKEFEFKEIEMTEGDNVAMHQLEIMLREDIDCGKQLSF